MARHKKTDLKVFVVVIPKEYAPVDCLYTISHHFAYSQVNDDLKCMHVPNSFPYWFSLYKLI